MTRSSLTSTAPCFIWKGLACGLSFVTWAQVPAARVELRQGQVEIRWAGQTRMSGLSPRFEGTAKPDHVSRKKSDSFSFSTVTGQSVDLQVHHGNHTNVVGLSLNPGSLPPAMGQQFSGLFFGQFEGYQQGVAAWRYKPWNSWTKPMCIKDPGQLESWDVQFFFWQNADGSYGAAMPLSGNGYRTTLGAEDHQFGAKAVSGVDHPIRGEIPMLAIGFGKDPYQLFQQLYEDGLEMMGKGENLRALKPYPEAMEYLGWCSWNASDNGNALNGNLVRKAVKSFQEQHLQLGWVILDDGWSQGTGDPKMLAAMEPDPVKFPGGFKPLVDELKTMFGLRYVGVWHAFNGYWAGIDPDSALGKRFASSLFGWTDANPVVPGSEKTRHMISPYSKDLATFYDEFHAGLKQQGIDFVKVDNQLISERMAKGNFPLFDFASAMHEKLNASVGKYFGNAVINCMDMTNDAFYNFGKTAIARCVEDYFPYEKGETYDMQKGNAAAHVCQALFNSLYFQQMAYPDFDMFESDNPNAGLHAAARAISGGPIYLTDRPGRQHPKVLAPLVTSDGRILRATQPARLTRDCLFQVQSPKPLKAFALAGESGLLFAFNAADVDHVEGMFRLSDIEGLKGEHFLVCEFQTASHGVYARSAALPLSLGRMEHRYFNVVPIKKGTALVGLLDKRNAPLTFRIAKQTRNRIEVELKDGGTFGAWLERAPKRLMAGDQTLTFTFKDHWLEVGIPGSGPTRLKLQF